MHYIEYCNFQFAVIHCLSIIHLKYYIEYIAECVLTLIYQIISITYCDFLFSNNNFVFGDTGFVVDTGLASWWLIHFAVAMALNVPELSFCFFSIMCNCGHECK